MPDSAERAAEIAGGGGVAQTEKITVRSVAGEKYDRVVGYEIGPMPEQLPVHEALGYDEEDIPF